MQLATDCIEARHWVLGGYSALPDLVLLNYKVNVTD